MKKNLLAAVLIIPFIFVMGCSKGQDVEKVSELKTPAEKLGYSLGSDIGKSFKKNEMDIDKNAFVQGFLDGLADAKPLLTPEERRDQVFADANFPQELRRPGPILGSLLSAAR
mgnify:CR=1 FL=1